MKKSFTIFFAVALFIFTAGCGGGSGPVAPPDIPDDGRVSGYTLLFPSMTARWNHASFPIKIWIDQPPVEAGPYGPDMTAAAVDGINMWNNVIDGVPVLFVNNPLQDDSDVTIRWEAMELGGYTLATPFDDRIRIHKAALNEELRDPEMIRLIMGHELGHVLGLDLSDVSGDLMYKTVDPASTSLTRRDRDMINWLYSQKNYFPIKSE